MTAPDPTEGNRAQRRSAAKKAPAKKPSPVGPTTADLAAEVETLKGQMAQVHKLLGKLIAAQAGPAIVSQMEEQIAAKLAAGEALD